MSFAFTVAATRSASQFSPFIESITINKYGKVRRSKLYYLRERTGKKARIQERRAK